MVLVDERFADLTLGPPRGAEVLPEPAPGAQRAARRALQAQVARLERDLADALISAFPRAGVDVTVPAPVAGPRLLGLGELERLRDDLAARLTAVRRDLAARGEHEARNRELLERMLLEPGRYKFARLRNADLGERGCGVWEVRPRLGLVGMLMGWWQVKLSSGCPLAGARRLRAGPPPRVPSRG